MNPKVQAHIPYFYIFFKLFVSFFHSVDNLNYDIQNAHILYLYFLPPDEHTIVNKSSSHSHFFEINIRIEIIPLLF